VCASWSRTKRNGNVTSLATRDGAIICSLKSNFHGSGIRKYSRSKREEFGLILQLSVFYKGMSLVFTPRSDVSRDIAIEKDIFADAPRRFE
jgi:hypothetical protein